MSRTSKAYLVGGGIGSLAAAAFMIRDGSLPGGNISILEASPLMAVYELLGIGRKIPPITPHDKSLRVQFEALIKVFK